MHEAPKIDLRERIEPILGDPDVLAVILFGSRSRGDAGSGSDTDICVVLHGVVPEKILYARKRLAYLSVCDSDIHVFQQMPLYLRRRVLQDGRVLFCRDEDALYDIACRTAQQFEDFRHIHTAYLEAVAHG